LIRFHRCAVFRFLGFVGLGLFGQQLLAVGDRYLVVIGMNFAERQKPVPVSAVVDEGGLKRRLHAHHLGQVDVPLELFLAGGFVVEFFEALATYHGHPRFFRVARINQHSPSHKA